MAQNFQQLSDEELTNVNGGTNESTETFLDPSELTLHQSVKIYIPNTMMKYVYLCNGSVNAVSPLKVIGTNGKSYNATNAKYQKA